MIVQSYAQVALAIGLALGCELLAFLVTRQSTATERGLSLILALAIATTPALVPLDRPMLRWIASLWVVCMLVRLWDLHVAVSIGCRPDFRAFAWFTANFFSVVLRKLDAEPRPSRGENLRRLAWSTPAVALCVALLVAAFRVDWSRLPIPTEHAAKATTVFVTVVPLTALLIALWRLVGGRGRDYMDYPLVARTPADFWRRYNRVAQQFFYLDVFLPAGGRRHPLRATLLTFAASALIHEYLFDMAAGRVQGYQTAFFMLQGLAVVATSRLKPRRSWAVLGIALTTAFNLASSLLFFASVNELLPFYSRPLPF